MQLIAPVRVIPVLEMKSLGDGWCKRDLAAVFTHGAAQGADRVVRLAERHVIPARDGAGRNAEITPGHGMRPGLLGKRADRSPGAIRAGGELKSEPTTENRNRAHKAPVEQGCFRVITSPHKLG